jgi:hypothetical protein
MLRAKGPVVNRKRVRRLGEGTGRQPQAGAAVDAQLGLRALGPRPRTTKPAPGRDAQGIAALGPRLRTTKPAPGRKIFAHGRCLLAG